MTQDTVFGLVGGFAIVTLIGLNVVGLVRQGKHKDESDTNFDTLKAESEKKLNALQDEFNGIAQALAGYKGQGGLIHEVGEVKTMVIGFMSKLDSQDRLLRQEIIDSRHGQDTKFTIKMAEESLEVRRITDDIEKRLRALESA